MPRGKLPIEIWLWLLFTCSVNAGKWEMSCESETCTAACIRVGLTCDAAALTEMRSITTTAELGTLANSLGLSFTYTNLVDEQNGHHHQNGFMPYYYNSGSYTLGHLHADPNPVCASAGGRNTNRFCYCSGAISASCSGFSLTASAIAQSQCPGSCATTTTTTTKTTTTTTTTMTASVAGDPITYYGGLRVEFEIPTRVPSLLLATSEMSVFGTTFQGWTKADQWINRLVVTTGKDEVMTDIKIKDNLVDFSRNQTAKDSFDTLDVAMFGRNVPFFPPQDAYFPSGTIVTTFARQWHLQPEVPRRECVMIAGVSFKLIACSTSAREYYGNYQPAATSHAHLDMDVLHMDQDKFMFSGILPELWGIAPISEATQKMIKSRRQVSNALGSSSASVDKAEVADTY